MNLLIELDGATVPLADCDYVLWSACGCPRGVTVCRDGVVSEEDAWKSFFPTKRERDRERKRGQWMELMTHSRWVAEVMPLMRSSSVCPHTLDGAAKGVSRA